MILVPKDLETPFWRPLLSQGDDLIDRGVSTLAFSRDTENAQTAKTTSGKTRKATTPGSRLGPTMTSDLYVPTITGIPLWFHLESILPL